MKFRVQWHSVATNALAQLWIESDSTLRELINESTKQIDRFLGDDPFGQSESRPGGRRIKFAPPLGVIFRIDQSRNEVRIYRVWILRKRRKL